MDLVGLDHRVGIEYTAAVRPMCKATEVVSQEIRLDPDHLKRHRLHPHQLDQAGLVDRVGNWKTSYTL